MFTSLITFLTFMFVLIYNFFFLTKKSKKKLIKLLFLLSTLSIISLSFCFLSGDPKMMFTLSWFSSTLKSFQLSFNFDSPFMLFSCVAITVTWSIIEFSFYYMHTDPKKQSFLSTLILFLFFMLMLTSSNNLFLLFMGWEGVGILSFMLMSWWFTRTDANSASLQAMIYKRMGDSGIILFISLSVIYTKSWSLTEMIFLKHNSPLSEWAMLGLILAAAGKSAQFGLHPWLPAAMEGPTPVSALLHSSTMVVAGVFLLFRTHLITFSYYWGPPLIAILGSCTALFASSVALLQYDMKKMMAYSTTSQLGLMVLAMGIKFPQLALFHICTHAFFKALLFLCSGSMIHKLNKEQDLRKMKKSSLFLPFTISCMIIGSLALCGMPFLAGFYSKDLILETCQKNLTKSISVMLALIATLMTAIYSFRMIYYLTKKIKTNTTIKPINEVSFNLFKPLLRLVMGAMLMGWMSSLLFFSIPPIIIPVMKKSLPFVLTITATILLFNLSPPYWPLTSMKFLSKNWFFVKFTHSLALIMSVKASILGVLRTLDQGWTPKFGVTWLSKNLIYYTSIISKSFTAMMTQYFSFLLMIMVLVIMIIS